MLHVQLRRALICVALSFAFTSCESMYEPVSRNAAIGIEHYEHGDYESALELYRRAQVDAPEDKRIALNIGNALYHTAAYEEAEHSYSDALAGGNRTVRAMAAYNVGNARFRQHRLSDAVEAYQRALGLNPNNEEAKFNLELAQLLLNHAAQQSEQQQRSEQPEITQWALQRIAEAEELARQGRYGEAMRRVHRTLDVDAAAQQRFGEFAERLSDLYRIFNR
jgi:Ca-activated chloride channel homolog